MQVAHHLERREHRRGQRRVLPPVPAAERHLDDLLTGAEAVVRRAAGEPLLAEPWVDAAAEVGRQVAAGPAGRLG